MPYSFPPPIRFEIDRTPPVKMSKQELDLFIEIWNDMDGSYIDPNYVQEMGEIFDEETEDVRSSREMHSEKEQQKEFVYQVENFGGNFCESPRVILNLATKLRKIWGIGY